jgi:hypothetical protein
MTDNDTITCQTRLIKCYTFLKCSSPADVVNLYKIWENVKCCNDKEYDSFDLKFLSKI